MTTPILVTLALAGTTWVPALIGVYRMVRPNPPGRHRANPDHYRQINDLKY